MTGTLYGLGVGPGDPELITVKALRFLQSCEVVAYPTGKPGGGGHALSVIEPYIKDDQILMPLLYPATAGPIADSEEYPGLIQDFFDRSAEEVAEHLEAERDVAFICLGDPFFYGSYMYWHARLADRYETVVVPGISSVMAAPVMLGKPLCHREDVVRVIPATLPEEEIEARLSERQPAVIMKLGRTVGKVRRVLERLGMLEEAYLVERATQGEQRILPMSDDAVETAGYFSVVVIPCKTPV